MSPTDTSVLAQSAAASGAIIGRREEQQDYVWIGAASMPGGGEAVLVLLADGMGGHAGGQIASQLAVDRFADSFLRACDQAVGDRLRNALSVANAALAERTAEEPGLKGMGCTLVAGLLQGDRLYWLSVGDSLLMLADAKGDVKRLNADHSMAPILDRQAADGEITLEEAKSSDERNMLRSALTGRKIALVDQGEITAPAGARVIAATDGLLTMPEGEFRALVTTERAPDRLIGRVLRQIEASMPDDQDNTTMAVVKTWAVSPAAPSGRRSPARLILAGVLFALVLAILTFVGFVLISGGGKAVDAPAPPDAGSDPIEPFAPQNRTDPGPEDNAISKKLRSRPTERPETDKSKDGKAKVAAPNDGKDKEARAPRTKQTSTPPADADRQPAAKAPAIAPASAPEPPPASLPSPAPAPASPPPAQDEDAARRTGPQMSA